MIRHLVLFKLNEGVSRDEARVRKAADALMALGGQIPELRTWEAAWNISDRAIAYDFAVNCTVDDQAALQVYLEHPAHRAAAAPWFEFASAVVADYEV